MNSLFLELRKKHNMTLRQLGAALGISFAYIQKIESGKIRPSFNTCRKYSDYFSVPINLFLPALTSDETGVITVDTLFETIRNFALSDDEEEKSLVDAVRWMFSTNTGLAFASCVRNFLSGSTDIGELTLQLQLIKFLRDTDSDKELYEIMFILSDKERMVNLLKS